MLLWKLVLVDVLCAGDEGQSWHLFSDKNQRKQQQQNVYKENLHRSQTYPPSQPAKSAACFRV